MRKFKLIFAGYISCIGEGNIGTEISEAEYAEIKAAIATKPPATETTDYWLREDLTWEEYEVEPPDPNPEIDDSEAWDIIFGGGGE